MGDLTLKRVTCFVTILLISLSLTNASSSTEMSTIESSTAAYENSTDATASVVSDSSVSMDSMTSTDNSQSMSTDYPSQSMNTDYSTDYTWPTDTMSTDYPSQSMNTDYSSDSTWPSNTMSTDNPSQSMNTDYSTDYTWPSDTMSTDYPSQSMNTDYSSDPTWSANTMSTDYPSQSMNTDYSSDSTWPSNTMSTDYPSQSMNTDYSSDSTWPSNTMSTDNPSQSMNTDYSTDYTWPSDTMSTDYPSQSMNTDYSSDPTWSANTMSTDYPSQSMNTDYSSDSTWSANTMSTDYPSQSMNTDYSSDSTWSADTISTDYPSQSINTDYSSDSTWPSNTMSTDYPSQSMNTDYSSDSTWSANTMSTDYPSQSMNTDYSSDSTWSANTMSTDYPSQSMNTDYSSDSTWSANTMSTDYPSQSMNTAYSSDSTWPSNTMSTDYPSQSMNTDYSSDPTWSANTMSTDYPSQSMNTDYSSDSTWPSQTMSTDYPSQSMNTDYSTDSTMLSQSMSTDYPSQSISTDYSSDSSMASQSMSTDYPTQTMSSDSSTDASVTPFTLPSNVTLDANYSQETVTYSESVTVPPKNLSWSLYNDTESTTEYLTESSVSAETSSTTEFPTQSASESPTMTDYSTESTEMLSSMSTVPVYTTSDSSATPSTLMDSSETSTDWTASTEYATSVQPSSTSDVSMTQYYSSSESSSSSFEASSTTDVSATQYTSSIAPTSTTDANATDSSSSIQPTTTDTSATDSSSSIQPTSATNNTATDSSSSIQPTSTTDASATDSSSSVTDSSSSIAPTSTTNASATDSFSNATDLSSSTTDSSSSATDSSSSIQPTATANTSATDSSLNATSSSSSLQSSDSSTLSTTASASPSSSSTTLASTTVTTTTTTSTTTTTTTTTTTPAPTTAFVSDTFAFGSSAGDSSFEGDDNIRAVNVNPPIPVGSITQVSTFYISTNGNIGLNKEFRWYWWHYYFRYSLTDPVLAVYWSDLDTKGIGNVFYHVYDSNDGSMSTSISTSIKHLITLNYPKATGFEPSWIMVVTWQNIDFYGWWWWFWSPSYNTETFSFQCIIASNRIDTYVLYNYMDINLQSWWYWYYVALGYRKGPFNNDLHVNPFMKQSWFQRRKSIFKIGTKPGNFRDGRNGKWLYRLTSGQSQVPSDELACYLWYQSQRGSLSLYTQRTFSFGNICPCWEFLINFDPFWSPGFYGSRTIYIWGLSMRCYASKRFVDHSVECCYRWGRYQRWAFWYGYGTYLNSNPHHNYAQYQINDLIPMTKCINTKHYEWIRESRPRGYCYTWNPFRISWTFGDPHVKTLDGKQYTFNGYGEYTMLKVENVNKTFTLQARTGLAVNAQGETTNATVFTGFAAKDHTNATLQVELSDNRTALVIFGNGIDRSNLFLNSNFSITEPNLILGKENQTLDAFFPNAGFSVKITVGVRLLTVVTTAPTDVQGQTKGLLGNFDDNPDNDFVKPDGTTIHTNSTQREIFNNFGQPWAITEQESLFNYTPGMSAADFQHPNFEPLFVDEVDPEKVANATTQCGGASASQACIFDLLATGDQALADASGQSEEQGDSEQTIASNTAPTISGNTTIYATVNTPVELRYTATDDGTVNVTFLDQPTSNFAYNVTDGEVYATWTPVDSSEAGISITAMDNNGASASPIDTIIVLCTGCNGNGVCNNSDTVASNDPNFFYAKCECNTGYEGNDCSNDTDGCASQPCDVDRTCIDLPPDEHARLDRGYNCSDCAAGYRENDTKCVDIDECDENPSICPQQCDNSEGNYSCSCYSTYRLLGDSCIDIDECAEQTAGCQQNCENTAGNFSCSCVYGYSLNADGKTCTQVLDACAIAGLTCSYACDNSTGAFQCICQNGYQLDSDGSSCVDLNECSQSVCTQECTNSVGSYTCSCYSGYTLSDDGTSCEECTVPNWGPNCANTCICGVGVDSCDPVQGCVCAEGYEGSDCGDDIDECTVNPGICSSDMICENLDGSYECLCYAGYTKVNNSCVDDDECASAATNVCPSESTCENNAGNYTCDCNAGYNQNGIRSCLDIDECTTGAHNCEQLCENVAGSYNCKCEFGFSLNADRVTCTKVSDPCASYGNLTCDYACKLNGTSVSCFCRSGYQLATDGQTCLDIDECSDSTLNLCSDPNTCVNQDGSFTCNCEDGNKLENDGVTCTPCDEFHYGTNCANSCNCGAGAERCDSVSGCVCMTGWTGDKCDADKDECQSSPSVCTGTNTQCLNSPGSYVCSCLTGYALVGSGPDCADIDECAGVTACSQTCTNTQGSYVCSCASGFRLTGGTTCTDIDECSASSPVCDQDCINTIGSFKCSCKDGFLLNSTTKNTCYAKTECNVVHSCNQTCFINTALQEECLCSSGYNLNADNQTCDNIDECAQGTPCASGTCTDSIPGFICSCDVGKKLAVDGVTCEDCEAWKFGTDCNTNCTCVIANSESCNNTDGTCTCKTGYEGADCGTDIDECATNAYTCPTNSACQNTNGSYVCNCNAGFAYAGGQCVACDSTTYGTNCAGQCTCNLQNTQDCDDVTGACTCKTGWDGTNCTNDIDECTTNNHTCGSNSHCVNTNGSYRCDCDSGWTGTGGSCNTDIDECLIPPPICGDHGNCSNYPGTYNCTCDKGWNGTNCEFGNCFIDRTICTGNTECVQNGTNTTCQCLPGYDAKCSVVDVTFQRTSLVITLDITVSNTSLSDNTSDEYAEIYQKIKTSLENYYASVLGNYLIGVILNSISYGSVIANHQVVTSSSDPAASAIAAAVRAMVDGTANFTYDGSVVNITSVSSNGVVITSSFTACQLFELTRTCASGYECVNDGTNTYCRAIATSDDDNLGLIIGLSVGASVLVIGIIVAIIIYQYKHKTGRYNTKKRVSLSQTLRGRRTASVGSVEFNDTLLKKEGSGISSNISLGKPSSANKGLHKSLHLREAKPTRVDVQPGASNLEAKLNF